MCGVVGVIGNPEAARETFLGLISLQHRGQDAAGILTYDETGFHRVKNVGLVESVFSREGMDTLTGRVAIGHTRYSTVGRGDLHDVQPLLISYPYGLGMVHNGNIVNTEELSDDLKSRSRRHLLTQSDTEIILNLFAEGIARATEPGEASSNAPQAPINPTSDGPLTFDHVCIALKTMFQRLNGSFSIICLIADSGLLAFRDPMGNRPMIWGKRANADGSGDSHMFASESVALEFQGYQIVRNLEPGEAAWINFKGEVETRILSRKARSACMFEWVYFASPESVMDGVPVYGARIQLGKSLAKLIQKQMDERGWDADVVVPVPETSRIAAISLAEELKIPYRELLIKNRYIKRTFILDTQEKRQKAVNLKLSPVRSEFEGKKVVLVDDSIVRGTTSKKIIDLVRHAGASKVYFVSTCPPIKYPCYYGIDFPSTSELLAAGRDTLQIEKELGADGVIYQDIEGLKSSIGRAAVEASTRGDISSELCMACIDGRYPTDVTSGKGFASNRAKDRRTVAGGRRDKDEVA